MAFLRRISPPPTVLLVPGAYAAAAQGGPFPAIELGQTRVSKTNDIGVMALSADALDQTRETVEQQGLEFPVAWGLQRADGEQVGATWEGQRGYIQPAQFILNARGDIMHTVYGEGPLGRISADDVLRWVAFQRSRAQGA